MHIAPETSFAEMFIDGAMMLAREGARVTKLHMPTRDFLWLAWQYNANDPSEPLRSVLRPLVLRTTDWANAGPTTPPTRFEFVRVGDRFSMQAPWGAVEIIEDKETP